MNTSFTYSIAIRTLGTAGEKYRKLLKSISSLTVQPEKIVVVLPEGYNPPRDQIGTEKFVFAQKGMITQRCKALEYINSDFILFCDDDVELESHFIEKLSVPLVSKEYDCSAGPLLDFFPPAGMKYLVASLLGGACKMVHGCRNTYVRILKTGGWSYNRSIDAKNHKIYKTESLPGTCFFIRTDAIKNIHFEDEIWAERNGYAAFEDRIMIYKLVKNGYKVCVVSDASYKHNDGKTSTAILKMEPIYAGAFNHYVFWHRYLYSLSSNLVDKLWLKICISYYMVMSRLYNKMLQAVGRSNIQTYHAMMQGFSDAKEFVKSVEYKNLPSVYS